MNYNLIIMVIAIALSFVYLLKYRNKITIIISLLEAIAVIMALSKGGLSFLSAYIFMMALIIAFIYPFIYKNNFIIPYKKYLLWGFLIPLFMKFLFDFFHWPGINLIGLFMIIPIIIFLYLVIFKRKEWIYEIGFMIPFFTDALIRFISLLFY